MPLSSSSTTTSLSDHRHQEGVRLVTPDQVVELGDMLRRANISLSAFLAEFSINNISMLCIDHLDDAKDWVDRKVVTG